MVSRSFSVCCKSRKAQILSPGDIAAFMTQQMKKLLTTVN